MNAALTAHSTPAPFLGILVDGSLVKAVYLVKREEGVIAHWPPESLDPEALTVGDNLSIPMRPGLYIVVGGDRLEDKYVGLVMGQGVLLLRFRGGVPVERVGEKLARTYLVFREGRLRNSGREEEGPGGEL